MRRVIALTCLVIAILLGAAEEFEPDLSPGLAAAQAKGYEVASVTLEARGLCPACRAG